MAAIDHVLGFGRILKTSIEKTTAILAQVSSSIGSLSPSDSDTDEGEVADGQDIYGGGATFFRPLPPSKVKGQEFQCDIVFAKTSDGLVPLAYRDLRLDKAFPSGPKEGSTGLRGYGGALASFDLVNDPGDASGKEKANTFTVYIPFEFSDQTVTLPDGSKTVRRVPSRAHAITIDPAQGLTLTHSDGRQVALTSEGILLTAGATSWMQLTPNGLTIQSPKVTVKGNVYLGAQAEAGPPLLAGPASPPSPSVFVSPV